MGNGLGRPIIGMLAVIECGLINHLGRETHKPAQINISCGFNRTGPLARIQFREVQNIQQKSESNEKQICFLK